MTAQSLASGAPVPSVDAEDVKRLWLKMRSLGQLSKGLNGRIGGGIGYDRKLLEPEVHSPNPDLVAVFGRMSMISYFEQNDLLSEWRTGDGFDDRVFQAAASFPLPNGIQGFSPDEFMARLKGL